MEIHIDTKKDSPEEIRKAIRMLQVYIGQNVSSNDSYGEVTGSEYSDFTPEASPGAFNMFGDDSSEGKDYDDKPKDKPDRVQIIEY